MLVFITLVTAVGFTFFELSEPFITFSHKPRPYCSLLFHFLTFALYHFLLPPVHSRVAAPTLPQWRPNRTSLPLTSPALSRGARRRGCRGFARSRFSNGSTTSM